MIQNHDSAFFGCSGSSWFFWFSVFFVAQTPLSLAGVFFELDPDMDSGGLFGNVAPAGGLFGAAPPVANASAEAADDGDAGMQEKP